LIKQEQEFLEILQQETPPVTQINATGSATNSLAAFLIMYNEFLQLYNQTTAL
jgi:hypothetical protein